MGSSASKPTARSEVDVIADNEQASAASEASGRLPPSKNPPYKNPARSSTFRQRLDEAAAVSGQTNAHALPRSSRRTPSAGQYDAVSATSHSPRTPLDHVAQAQQQVDQQLLAEAAYSDALAEDEPLIDADIVIAEDDDAEPGAEVEDGADPTLSLPEAGVPGHHGETSMREPSPELGTDPPDASNLTRTPEATKRRRPRRPRKTATGALPREDEGELLEEPRPGRLKRPVRTSRTFTAEVGRPQTRARTAAAIEPVRSSQQRGPGKLPRMRSAMVEIPRRQRESHVDRGQDKNITVATNSAINASNNRSGRQSKSNEADTADSGEEADEPEIGESDAGGGDADMVADQADVAAEDEAVNNSIFVDESERIDSDGASEAGQYRSRKRKHVPPEVAANTARKRSRRAVEQAGSSSSDAQPRLATTQVSSRRLYGQYDRLQEIYEARTKVGWTHKGDEREHHKIRLVDRTVNSIIKLCDKALEKYALPQETTAADEVGDEPTDLLANIRNDVYALYKKPARGAEPDFENTNRGDCIHYHLIPKLVELLVQATSYYSYLDHNDFEDDNISRDHLTTVVGLVKEVINLAHGATKYDVSVHGLRGPVRNDMIAPLKIVQTAFNTKLQKLTRDAELDDLYVARAERRRIGEENERLELEEKKQFHARQDKMKSLHNRRILSVPIYQSTINGHWDPPDILPELDQNGTAFERVQVFSPRVNLTPTRAAKARSVWSTDQYKALVGGLMRYHGPRVYENIVHAYCQPRQPLEQFNMTEIMVAASDFKHFTIKEAEEMGTGEVEQWVRDIPEWSESHSLLGQENSVIEIDD